MEESGKQWGDGRVEEQRWIAEPQRHVGLPPGIDEAVLEQCVGLECSPEVEDVVVAAGEVVGQQGLKGWDREQRKGYGGNDQ